MTDLTPEERALTPEEQKMLFEIAAASRTRQNHYLPEWVPNQTYGDLQPGHNLDMASVQHHLADLIVLTDWMPRVLAALVASEAEVSRLTQERDISLSTSAILRGYAYDAEDRLSKLEDALTDLTEAVETYREGRHGSSEAITATDSQVAMYRAAHRAREVLEDSH